MLDQPQEIQDLVHQWFTGLRESNNAANRALEHVNLILQLKDEYIKRVNELTDPLLKPERAEWLQNEINTINSQIIYHANQQREWQQIRKQKWEEIKQIKSNPEAKQQIEIINERNLS